MTNGEKIKATFPHYDIEIDELKGYVRIFYENFYTTYSWNWWNAEYKEPRWIPVNERLPENKEIVLVTFHHFVSGNTIGLGSVVLLRGKPYWHVREQNLGTYDVLAWMPLPEPYKGVEE